MTLDTDHPQMSLLAAATGQDDWIVRANPRARRLSVRVFMTGRVEVVVPPRTSATTVQRFLERHRDWIADRRRAARHTPQRVDRLPPGQIELPGIGEAWRVHVAGGSGRVRVSAARGIVRITGSASGDREMAAALRSWIVARTRVAFEGSLAALARETGLEYRRLAIRCQRTRWGSCSSRGTISLNVCLAFQRSDVVRYLMLHELAHTRHMNHSRRFWSLVGDLSPGFEALDAELENGWRHVPSWMFMS